MTLPVAFCWTKYGVEAGEAPEKIWARKQRERDANNGVFLWGLGSSIRPSLLALLEEDLSPHVLFTPMISSPDESDVSPTNVLLWTSAKGIYGEEYQLPPATIVTSRESTRAGRARHYALVCSAADTFDAREGGESFSADDVRNYRSGSRVGASQVTAVVRRATGPLSSDGAYQVHLSAKLVYPYFVELAKPVRVTGDLRLDLAQFPQSVEEQVLALVNGR